MTVELLEVSGVGNSVGLSFLDYPKVVLTWKSETSTHPGVGCGGFARRAL